MTIGIDKGTTYTKDSEGNIIKSTVKVITDDILLANKLLVEMDCRKYIIGEKGNFSTDLMKGNHDNTKILVYTLLALGLKDKEYFNDNVVIGLPIGLYGKNKEILKKQFAGKDKMISICGKKKYIRIDKVEVFPEAAGAFYTQPKPNALVLDFGGLSIDTALFKKSRLQKYSTYSMGTMKLYSKIANKINGDFDLSLTEWDIPGILNKGLKIYGKQQDINISSIINSHILEIVERLKLEYDLKVIDDILLTGGGSILLEEYIKKHIPQAYKIETTFANAKGFKLVGEQLFK